MKTNTNSRTLKMVQLALLIAIIVLMAFTPIGYIKTFGLEITLIVVPVTVGAIVLGPASGAVLGAVFGITSFIQCFGWSPFGATLLSINPIYTFIVCFIPRVLMGWLTGLIFVAIRNNNRTKRISYLLASLIGPLLNTLFFMTALVLFFYQTDYIQGFVEILGTSNVFTFVIAFVGINGLIEALTCFVLASAVSKVLDSLVMKVSS
ncbi:MAG TPA: ECF transporter S component [Clostridiales bacterium]|nr:ECF transporter S component [Clostridiales bacterium]